MARSSNTGYPYATRTYDRHGKARVRFRRNGFSTYLPLTNSPDFGAAYAEAMLTSSAERPKEIRARKFTLEWTVIKLTEEMKRRDLTENTIKGKTRNLGRMVKAWGDVDMRTLTRAGVIERLNMIEKPTTRNRIRGLFLEMFTLLLDMEIVTANPVLTIKRVDQATKHTPPWTPEECAKFEGAYPSGSMARLAYELFRCTVQASVDVCQMTPSMIKDDMMIEGKRQKTGVAFRIIATQRLMNEIAAHDEIGTNEYYIKTEAGKPFTPDGFNNRMNKWIKDAGIDARSHGLRVLGCVELAESGCSAKEIMAISGHKTLAEAQRYVEMANQRKLARSANTKRLQSNL